MKSKFKKPFDMDLMAKIEGKYNLSLRELIFDKFNNLQQFWSWIMVGIAPVTDTPFITAFKLLFVAYYHYHELAYYTYTEVYSHFYSTWVSNIEKWERLFTLYNDQLASDPLITQKFTTKTEVDALVKSIVDGLVTSRFSDTPQSSVTTLDDGYLSSITDSKDDSETSASTESETLTIYEGFNEQEILLLNSYADNMRSVVEEAVKAFRPLFLMVY